MLNVAVAIDGQSYTSNKVKRRQHLSNSKEFYSFDTDLHVGNGSCDSSIAVLETFETNIYCLQIPFWSVLPIATERVVPSVGAVSGGTVIKVWQSGYNVMK